MKKFLTFILTLLISLNFVFAQEAQVQDEVVFDTNGKYLGFIKDMRGGAFFNFEPSIGDLNEFVFSTLGGGLNFEAGIPLPLFSESSVIHELMENFGVSFRIAFDGGIMRDTCIDSIFSMRYMTGVYTRIPLPGDMFTIVPEFNYGLVLNLPTASGTGAEYVKGIYADQILQFGAGIRFTHPSLLDEQLEFEFTPTYSFSPEAGSSVHYLGFRLGVSYKFADAGNVSSARNNNYLEKEHIQLTPVLTQRKNKLTERAEYLKLEFEELALDAKENNLRSLARKYEGYEKQVQSILEELYYADTEDTLDAVEKKLSQIEGKLGNLEEIEKTSEVELDMAVTEMAAKTGHAALIRHPDGSYTIAIPPLVFEADATSLVLSDQNRKSLDTLIEVLTTDNRIEGMIVSVYGYINPDSRSELWTKEEKELAKGRAEAIARYLIENGCNHKVDFHAGEGYTDNAVFNRRVEFLVHD